MTTSNTHHAADLYNGRFEQFGRDLRTVGWGSREDQRLRFDVLFRGTDPRGMVILDVGCGLGDLVPYLEERTGGDFQYVGVDVAEKLVADACAAHSAPNCRFLHGDVFTIEPGPVDFAVLSGALSLKIEGIELYAQRVMERMFALSRHSASLNFLSKYVDYELDKNQHYQPEVVFSWAKRITRKVNLFHDYPLYEFTVQLLH